MSGIVITIPLTQFKYIDPCKYNIYIYIYIADKEMVSSSGNSILYSVLALLTVNILIAIICAGSMSFLFPLFNMIHFNQPITSTAN